MPSARPLKIRAVSLYPYWSKPAADTAVAPRRSIETIPPASHALFTVRLILNMFLIIIPIVLHFPLHLQTRRHARETTENVALFARAAHRKGVTCERIAWGIFFLV